MDTKQPLRNVKNDGFGNFWRLKIKTFALSKLAKNLYIWCTVYWVTNRKCLWLVEIAQKCTFYRPIARSKLVDNWLFQILANLVKKSNVFLWKYFSWLLPYRYLNMDFQLDSLCWVIFRKCNNLGPSNLNGRNAILLEKFIFYKKRVVLGSSQIENSNCEYQFIVHRTNSNMFIYS